MQSATFAVLVLVLALGRTGVPTTGVRASTAATPRFLLFTRAHHDAPFVEFFVDYYDALGFDRILLLDTGNHSLLNVARPEKLELHHVPNHADGLLAEYLHLALAARAEWFFTVDADEFLVLDAPSIGAFVDRVEAAHGRVDMFYFRWLMVDHMAPFCAEEQPFARMVLGSATTPHFLHRCCARVAVGALARPELRAGSHCAPPLVRAPAAGTLCARRSPRPSGRTASTRQTASRACACITTASCRPCGQVQRAARST